MNSRTNDVVESFRGYRRASWQVLGFAALSSVCGCSGEAVPSDPDEAIAVENEALATPRLATPPTPGGMRLFTETNNVVDICFHNAPQDIRIKMRAAVLKTWGSVARLRFTGWDDCPADPDDIPETTIPIDVFENTGTGHENDNGGNCQGGVGSRQLRAEDGGDPRIHENTQLFINTGANRNLLESDTIHEMAHCLGVMHEHQRSDTPASCGELLQTTPVTGTGTCTVHSDCASHICSTQSRRCVLRGCSVTLCPSGFTCNAAERCVPDECTTASDCFGNSACNLLDGKRRCVTRCTTDVDCPAQHWCDTSFPTNSTPGRCADGNMFIDRTSVNLTPWDPTSIMTYSACRTPSAPLDPSFWDIYGMRALYGQRGLNQIVTSRSGTSGDYTVGTPPPTGYILTYAEGWGWGRGMPGTTPLQVYFHSGRRDRMVVGTAASRTEATNAGYLLEGTVSNVYASDQGNATVPMERFRSPSGTEHITTASPAAKQRVLGLGYAFVRVEGYVFPAPDHPDAFGIPFDTLTYYYSPSRNDSLITKTGSALALEAEAEGYEHRGLDGITLKRGVQGTTPLRQYWHNGRTDHFAAATPEGINAAITEGYRQVQPHEGNVFTTLQNDTQGLSLFWKSSIVDNWTTAERTNTSGYTFVRFEGYVMPALW